MYSPYVAVRETNASQYECILTWASRKLAWASAILYRTYKGHLFLGKCSKILFPTLCWFQIVSSHKGAQVINSHNDTQVISSHNDTMFSPFQDAVSANLCWFLAGECLYGQVYRRFKGKNSVELSKLSITLPAEKLRYGDYSLLLASVCLSVHPSTDRFLSNLIVYAHIMLILPPISPVMWRCVAYEKITEFWRVIESVEFDFWGHGFWLPLLGPCDLYQVLQLIWRLGTRRWNLRVPILQMSCSDLTEWVSASLAATVMVTWGLFTNMD